MKKIYKNAQIYTLKAKDDKHEAMLVEDGIIKKIGLEKDILAEKTNDIEVIDLDSKVVLPAFINMNSSVVAFAQSLMFCDLTEVKTLERLKNSINSYISLNRFEDNEVVLCMGLENKTFNKDEINKELLDSISNKLSIILTNENGTECILNSHAIDNIFKKENSLKEFEFKDNGKVDKDSFIKLVPFIPSKKMEDILKVFKIAQNIFLSYGIVTTQDNLYFSKELNVLTTLASNEDLKLDVVAHLELNEFRDLFPVIKDKLIGYSKGFRVGGLRINIDGLLETKTAFLSEEYLDKTNLDEKNVKGVLVADIKNIEHNIEWAISQNTQLFVGANGDKALDLYLNYLQSKEINSLKTFINKRPLVNSFFFNSKDISRMKLLQINPSLFISHIWHFGDLHTQNINKRLIDSLLLTKKLEENNLITSVYQDSILVKPNMFESIWTLTHRKTRGGIEISSQDKLDVYEALKTITINPAYQLHEETRKGTLEENKFADFIVLEEDPFNIEKGYLSSIKVIETFKRGNSIWKRQNKNN